MDILYFVGTGAGALVAILIGMAMILKLFYRKVDQGRALIINRMQGDPEVKFTGGLVLPVIHRAETMDISLKTIELDRRGKEGLICRDNIRADIKVTFFVKVNKTKEDVLRVAQQVGCNRASDQATLEQLFQAKFSEALKTVGKQLDFEALYTQRHDFKDQIIRNIGTDLNGYVLDDAAIDFLEQTPIETLDPENILDAQGIRKITELTTLQNIQTNLLRQNERKEVTKQNVEAEAAVLSLERQEKDARAVQAREIAVRKAREEAETARVQAEEYQKAQLAKIAAEQEVEVGQEAKRRQIEIAQKARERAIAVETERVEKDRMLEAISRERETELQRIAKEREIEVEKKNIADVVRDRIAVEKNVAEEEERIADLRAIMTAKREKEVLVTAASAEAEEKLIATTRAAEAKEQAARHAAKERLTLAEADLEAADRDAKAKARLAEGRQAEAAADGLAKARVREADALALEKEGAAKARVTREQLEAEARGHEERGMAEVRVKEADAAAVEKRGIADATVLERTALAEAVGIEKKLAAEASGIAEKARAMAALDEASRSHEEYRLRLEHDRALSLARITAEERIAKERAAILKEAFSAANIQIVGGDGAFFDRFVQAVSVGRSVDGALDGSTHLKSLFGDYLNGGRSLPAELIDAVGSLGAAGVRDLSVSTLIARLMAGADAPTRVKLEALADRANELGLDTNRGPVN